MNTKEAKKVVRNFMREHYGDERLAMLLAHAEDGQLAFYSCCCFIGVLTADHPLRGHSKLVCLSAGLPGGAPDFVFAKHYLRAKLIPGSCRAEDAYQDLGDCDNCRQAVLTKLIRAEMKRRAADAAVTREREAEAAETSDRG